MTKLRPATPPARHIPQRTCIGCHTVFSKRDLVRLVCLAEPEGGVEVDLTGKKSGRGAYLCHSLACWEAALESGRLDHAMRTSIKPEVKNILVNYAKGLNNTGR
jgi:uncharacterized protein